MSTHTDPRDTSAPRLYLAMYPGRVYHLDGLDDEEPDWRHIHRVLSRIHRFGGRSRLTVLHHALTAYELAGAGNGATRLLAFIHDHHEALVGDVPYPIKRALGGAFSEVEGAAESYVRRRFDLTAADVARVKRIDVALTFGEAIYTGIATWGCPWIAESGFSLKDYAAVKLAIQAVAAFSTRALIDLADSMIGTFPRRAP